MKKIIFLLLSLVMLIKVGETNEYQASTPTYNMANTFPKGINYLDLRYINYPMGGDYGRFEIPVMVEKEKKYTLIIGESILEQHYENLDLTYFEIIEVNKQLSSKQKLIPTRIKGIELGYYTFTAGDSLLRFEKLPMRYPKNGEIMLIEGEISNFERFENYLGVRKESDHLDSVIFSNIETKLDINSIKEKIKFYNNTLQYEIIVKEDSYTNNYNIIGNHKVKYHIKSEQHTLVYNLEIRVVDLIPPTISGPQYLVFDENEEVTSEKILTNYSFYDVVTPYDKIRKTIVYNEYVGNKGKKGSYEVKIRIEDEAGNHAEKIVVLRIGINNFGPAIMEGPGVIYVYKDDAPITDEEILAKFHLKEGFDISKLKIDTFINGYEQNTRSGYYDMHLIYSYQETTNHKLFHDVKFKVVVLDQNRPEVMPVNLLLSISKANLMTIEEIKEYIINETLKVNPQAKNFRFTLNEYENYNDAQSEYSIYFEYEVNDMLVKDKMELSVSNELEKSFNYEYLMIGIGAIAVLGITVLIICLYRKKKIDSATKK